MERDANPGIWPTVLTSEGAAPLRLGAVASIPSHKTSDCPLEDFAPECVVWLDWRCISYMLAGPVS